MKNNTITPLQWHFATIKDELCWVLRFNYAEWLAENLYFMETLKIAFQKVSFIYFGSLFLKHYRLFGTFLT